MRPIRQAPFGPSSWPRAGQAWRLLWSQTCQE